MSYSKLFGSILDSTVWQTPAHVRLVWITMLAMKDQDGIVEAAIPGLAKRAGVELAQCEEALTVLSSPDPYSRTPDFEGRRIRAVDGGWEVLNHLKYRDKLDREDRRAKSAARTARHRDKAKKAKQEPSSTHASRSVTLGNAPSRSVTVSTPSDAEADPFPEESARSGSGSGSATSLSPEPPDQGGGGDRVQAAVVRPAPAPESPVRVRPSDPSDPRAAEQTRLVRVLSALHAKLFNALRSELKAQVPAMQLIGDPAERALRELVAAQGSLSGFEDLGRHVLSVREAEARREGSLRWFGASLWRPDTFGIALSMQVGEDRSARGTASVFDVVDATISRMTDGDRE